MNRKKELSIGESLRGRMSDLRPDDTLHDDNETVFGHVEAENEPKSAGLNPIPPEAASTPPSVLDPLESFNTRLRQSTHRKLKVYCALNNLKIQDVVNEAVTAFLVSKDER